MIDAWQAACGRKRCANFPACSQAVEAAEGDSGGGGKLKSGVALAAARAWRRLVGEATAEVRWLPTGCLRLLDTLHQVGATGAAAALSLCCLLLERSGGLARRCGPAAPE